MAKPKVNDQNYVKQPAVAICEIGKKITVTEDGYCIKKFEKALILQFQLFQQQLFQWLEFQ